MGEGRRMAPPLAYIRRGRPPFFHHLIELSLSLSLFLRPRADSPCLESAPGLGFSTIRQAIVLLESGSVAVFFPLLAWFGARREQRLHRTCVIPRGTTFVVLLHRLEVAESLQCRESSTRQGGRRFRFYANHVRKNVSLFRSSKV